MGLPSPLLPPLPVRSKCWLVWSAASKPVPFTCFGKSASCFRGQAVAWLCNRTLPTYRCRLPRCSAPCRADRSNYDEHNDEDWENSQFDRETAALVLKVLTAKATQRLLLQLQVRQELEREFAGMQPPALLRQAQSSSAPRRPCRRSWMCSRRSGSPTTAASTRLRGATRCAVGVHAAGAQVQDSASPLGLLLTRQPCSPASRSTATPSPRSHPASRPVPLPRTPRPAVPAGPASAEGHHRAGRLHGHHPHHRPRQPSTPHCADPLRDGVHHGQVPKVSGGTRRVGSQAAAERRRAPGLQ